MAGVGGYTIREARASEAVACRMLLPAAYGPYEAPDRVLVAVAEDCGALLGAVAVTWRVATDAPGFPVLVGVVPPARRGGLGRALLDAAAADAAEEVQGLRAWQPLPAESVEAAFLRACGFASHHALHTWEMDRDGARALDATLAAALERLRLRGRVPAGVRVVPLAEAPAREVALLAVRHFQGITPAAVLRMEAGDFAPYDPAWSVAVLLAGRVAGVALCRAEEGVLHVEINVVDPAYRRGWANLMVVQAVVRHGLGRGLAACRFLSDGRVRDTMNIGQRAGARVVAAAEVLVRLPG